MPGFLEHADLWRDQVIAGIVAGALCGYLGILVILRRIVFVSAALGEIAGVGVVLAFLLAAHATPPVEPREPARPADAGVHAHVANESAPPILSDEDLRDLLESVGVERADVALGAGSPASEVPAQAPQAPPAEAGDGHHGGVPPWLHPMLVAIVFVVVAAVAMSLAPRFRRITQESVVAFAYLLAAGLVILIGSRVPHGAHEIRHVLYGDSVSLDTGQLWGLLGAAASVAALHAALFKEFLFVSFDPETARVTGIPTRLVGVLLTVSIGLVIATASRAIGALPVFAFLVLPPAAALLAASSLRSAFLVSALLGAVASSLGYYLAWIWSLPAGATRVVTAAAFLVPALLVRWRRGA